MSDLPPAGMPGTPPGGAQPGEPSEEEVRQYLAQMRATPAEQVVAEVLQGLLNAAQVKLGRRDARLLLDAAADVTERTAPALSDDLRTQLGEVLSQLRMGQVQAEREVAASGQDEVNDLASDERDADSDGDEPAGTSTGDASDSQPTPPSGRTARPSAPGGSPGEAPAGPGGASPLDKLWIPGR